MAGEPYSAGGIDVTVAATRQAATTSCARRATALVAEARRSGTTTIEIKSGYGLSTRPRAAPAAGGRRADRRRRRSSAPTSFPPSTPGGPTTTSPRLRRDARRLRPARPLDRRLLRDRRVHAGAVPCRARGRTPGRARVCACTPTSSAPVTGSVSASSWAARPSTTARTSPIETSRRSPGSPTVATFLPATDFSTRQPYPDARRVLDAGATVALAANCNPGSSYTTSMPFCVALAVRDLGMTPDEAILAATAGGAAALRRDDIGRLAPGGASRSDRPRCAVADRLRVPPRRADRRR